MPSSNDSLSVESSLDLLIALLYAPGKSGREGEPVDGITRLQKLMFLLNQGQGPKLLVKAAEEYLFGAYKMGPFTVELYRDLELLQSLGLLRTERLDYVISDDRDRNPDESGEGDAVREIESVRFRLTEHGIEAGKELFGSLPKRDREGLVEFKRFFNSLSLRQLLIFVYQKFPDFTSKSEIKGQLGLE
jgi:uncharacterized protein YwgA